MDSRNSFGLLDDKFLRESNASFTNFSTEKRVTDKPPKPLKPNQASDSDDNLIGPTSSDHENDVSTVSVHINEDDLKQFEGDLTLAENEEEEEDDDADCDDDKENQNIPSRQSDQGFKLGLTGRNKQFSFLTNSIASHHANDLTNVSEATFFDFDDGRFKSTVSEEVSMSNLMDESANILRNSSAELETPSMLRTLSKSSLANQQVLDRSSTQSQKSPTKRPSTGLTTTTRPPKSRFINESDHSKLEIDSEKSNTFDEETSSDRVNKLILQSIERSKRRQSEITMANDPTDHYSDIINNYQSKSLNKTNIESDISRWNMSISNGDFQENPINELSKTKTLDKRPSDQHENKSFIEGELPSIYFKPGARQLDDSDPIRRTTWSIPTTNNPFEAAGQDADQIFGLGAECFGAPVINVDDLGQFRDAEECASDLDRDEAQNRKEFADNNLTIAFNQTLGNNGGNMSTSVASSGQASPAEVAEKWWVNANQVLQTSKLELSVNSSQWIDTGDRRQPDHHLKIPAVDYFSQRSTMPDICQSESDVQISDSVLVGREKGAKNEPNESGGDETLCEDKENIVGKSEFQQNVEPPTPQSKTMTNDDTTNITFSSNGSTPMTSKSNFSFTFNLDPDKGDFILKKEKPSRVEPDSGKNKQDKLDLKSMDDELDQVSKRIRSAGKKTDSKSKPGQSITSTPTRSQISGHKTSRDKSLDEKSVDRDNDNGSTTASGVDLFNQDSFISSIPDHRHGEDDTTLLSSSIHRMHRNMRSKKKSGVQSSTAISSPTKSTTHRHHHHSKPGKHSTSPPPNGSSNSNTSSKKTITSTMISNRRSGGGVDDEDESTIDKLSARISLASVSSASSSSGAAPALVSPSETIGGNNSGGGGHLSHTSGMNIMPNWTNNGNMGPVMLVPFVPLNSPYFQSAQSGASSVNGTLINHNMGGSVPGSNYSSFSMPTAMNQPSYHPGFNQHMFPSMPTMMPGYQVPGGLSNSTSLNSLSSSCSTSSSNLHSSSLGISTLPKIEFEPPAVDFGPIAEGCLSQLLVYIRILNADSITGLVDSTSTLSLQVELTGSSDWTIETVDSDTLKPNSSKNNQRKPSLLHKKLNKDIVRSALEKTLSLTGCDPSSELSGSSNRLTMQPLSRFHQFYLRLDTRHVSMFRDLVSNQFDASSTEQLDPLLVHTYALVYLVVTGPQSIANQGPKRYLLDRIELKFILGYARLRSADQIEFMLSTNEAESSLTPSSVISEQIVTLSNMGNIPVDVDCYLISSSSGSKIPQQSIRFKQFEIRVDEALLSLAPRAKSKQSTRLLMYRANRQSSSHLGGDNLDVDGVRLCIEINPSGYKHELPVKIRWQEKRLKSPKISSTRTILFFGPSLNPSSRQNHDLESGMQDEFVIANSNEVRLTYKLSIDEDVEGAFGFVIVEKEARQVTPTVMEFVLEPKKQMRVGVRLRRVRSDMDVIMGTIRIDIRECEFKESFRIQLVAFQFETGLAVIDNRMTDKRSGSDVSGKIQMNNLIEQLKYRSIKFSRQTIELIRPLVASNINLVKKNLQLKNKSDVYKCIVYPVVFNTKSGKEISAISNRPSEVSYDLGTSTRLKLVISHAHEILNNETHIWIELRRSEEMNVGIELVSSTSFDISDVRVCFFYVEYDIAAYSVYNYLQAAAGNESMSGSHLVDSLAKRFIVNSELLTAGELLCSNTMNESTVSRLNFRRASTSSSAASSTNTSISDDSTLNMSSLMTRLGSKPRTFREDFLRLFRQSLKCCLIAPVISYEPTIQESKAKSSAKSDSNLIRLGVKSDQTNDENSRCSLESDSPGPMSWSASPSSLRIQAGDLTPHVLVITNRLNRKPLAFDVRYRPEYLIVEPKQGCVDALGSVELRVRAVSSLCLTEPWLGTITIWCNQFNRDVQVVIEPAERPRRFEASTPSARQQSDFEQDSLEPGAIAAQDLEPSSFDSLMALTPLISASLTPRFINSFVNSTSSSNSSTSSLVSVSQLPPGVASSTEITKNESLYSVPKIDKVGSNGFQVTFNQVYLNQTKSVELTLTNPTMHYVVWKAYSESPASFRVETDASSLIQLDTTLKSNLSVFSISPRSGSIPSMQKQAIRIEFSPRQSPGLYKQTWCIDTRVESSRLSSLLPLDDNQSAYQCKLMLSGRGVASSSHTPPILLRQEDDIVSRMTNRILKSKNNLIPDDPKLSISSNPRKDVENSTASTSMISQFSQSSTSISSSALGSNNSSKSPIINPVCLRNETIAFPDTEPNQTSQCLLGINNRDESTEHKVIVLSTIQPPFVCKKTSQEIGIKPKHYLKIPIEFKPRVVGRYEEKVVVKVEPLGYLISCKLVANCVAAKN